MITIIEKIYDSINSVWNFIYESTKKDVLLFFVIWIILIALILGN